MDPCKFWSQIIFLNWVNRLGMPNVNVRTTQIYLFACGFCIQHLYTGDWTQKKKISNDSSLASTQKKTLWIHLLNVYGMDGV